MKFNLNEFFLGLPAFMKARNILLLLAVIAAIILYNVVINFYSPANNLISKLFPDHINYTFFSGSPKGFYIVVGESLVEESKKNNDFVLSNEPSNGGVENFSRVISHANSFALVPEYLLQEKDRMSEYINAVSPLYIERLHVLYNTEMIPGEHLLTGYLPGSTKALFKKGVSIGPVGSGTNVLTSMIINELRQNDTSWTFNTFDESTEEAFASLKDKKTGIMFTVAGAPIPEVTELLQDSTFAIMPIDPSFILQLNKSYNHNFRITNFNTKYNDTQIHKATTIGSYAYLVSSKDVPGHVIAKVLQMLEQAKPRIKEKLDLKADEEAQLEEFNFWKNYTMVQEHEEVAFAKDLILFLITTVTSTIFFMWLFIWIVSNLKMARYFRRGTQLYAGFVPKHSNTEMVANENSDIDIALVDDQKGLVRKLIHALNGYYMMKEAIVKDYETGGITESHFRGLISSTDGTVEELQGMLARRIFWLIHNSNAMELEIIRKYYVVGFIKRERFLEMEALLKASK